MNVRTARDFSVELLQSYEVFVHCRWWSTQNRANCRQLTEHVKKTQNVDSSDTTKYNRRILYTKPGAPFAIARCSSGADSGSGGY